MDPHKDPEIFGPLLAHLEDTRISTPPPLHIDDKGGEDDEGGGPDAPGEGGQLGGEPLIQVQPFHAQGGPEGPGDEGVIPTLAEDPTLLNIYLRVWVRYAFYGVTQEVISSTLVSHKLALLAATAHSAFAPEVVLQI
ncbi:hypothetical protein FRC06_001741 [Ceratobasidium sp. 370]|nr:hypothetical protein FRC06_001741 [Ceratobasidium sp. 370]